MKHSKLLLINALLIFSFSMIAQEKTEEEADVVFNSFSIAVKGGFNFATATKGMGSSPPDARASIYVGGVVEVPIVENIFSLQGEAIYSGQGFERNYSYLGEKHQTLYKLDYINVPIFGKYYLLKGFSLEAGPQFSFLVNHKIQNSLDQLEREKEEINDFEIGIAAGITFQFDSGLFINGRYNHGFQDIFDNYNGKNTVIQFGVGYKF